MGWLLKKDRIAANPLDRVDVPATGKKTKERRALTAALIQKLLDAARQRPITAFIERYGDSIRDEVRTKLVLRGRERALLYKAAVYTGLRRGELAALRPCHLELGKKPFPRVEIPGKLTKNSQQARLLLVPSFAKELQEWIEETKKGPDDPLFHVPQASVRIMQKDLELAGIPYRTSQGDADFHSLRMTSNVMLGQAGIPARIAADLGVHRKTVTRWVNAYCDGGLNALRPKKAKGTPGHIPKTLVDEVKRWVIEGPAKQGLDRANWTHEELADHLLKTQGIRTSRSAVQRFCSGIGIRLYRPTYRHDRGDPVKQAKAREDLADLGKERRPVNSSC